MVYSFHVFFWREDSWGRLSFKNYEEMISIIRQLLHSVNTLDVGSNHESLCPCVSQATVWALTSCALTGAEFLKGASSHSRSPRKQNCLEKGLGFNWKHHPCALLKDRHPFIKKRRVACYLTRNHPLSLAPPIAGSSHLDKGRPRVKWQHVLLQLPLDIVWQWSLLQPDLLSKLPRWSHCNRHPLCHGEHWHHVANRPVYEHKCTTSHRYLCDPVHFQAKNPSWSLHKLHDDLDHQVHDTYCLESNLSAHHHVDRVVNLHQRPCGKKHRVREVNSEISNSSREDFQ